MRFSDKTAIVIGAASGIGFVNGTSPIVDEEAHEQPADATTA